MRRVGQIVDFMSGKQSPMGRGDSRRGIDLASVHKCQYDGSWQLCSALLPGAAVQRTANLHGAEPQSQDGGARLAPWRRWQFDRHLAGFVQNIHGGEQVRSVNQPTILGGTHQQLDVRGPEPSAIGRR